MVENNVFFSIVVPVYGAEKYLSHSLEDLRNQTCKDFEVILVDDCSKDKSGIICDEYTKKDDRFHCIHHEKNGGLSIARNTGLNNATGKYVLFLDPDDRYDLQLLEKCKAILEKQPVDLLVYGLIEKYYNPKEECINTQRIELKEGYYTTKNDIDRAVLDLESKTAFGYAWNKCFLRSKIIEHHLQYQTIRMVEDILFNLDLLPYINTLYVSNDCLYQYIIRRKANLTNQYFPEFFAVHETRVERFLQYYENSSKEIQEEAYPILANIYARYLLAALVRNCSKESKLSHSDRSQWLKKVYTSDLFKTLRPYMHADSKVVRLLESSFIKEQVQIPLMEARMIYFVRTYCASLFNKLKQKRQ